ncbi:beta strand repeat-containing protein, partial [Ferruginibacter sp. SUN002]|uniref:beta strand repeat-containing protein n=1 Tax=Ferruginibacter sp. SUN002 TaxID=2937789 RepID=UPI003D36B3D6
MNCNLTLTSFKKNLLRFSFLFVALVAIASSGLGQAASGTWALTANANAAIVGNVAGGAQTGGSGIGAMTFTANGVSSNGWGSTGLDANDYYQFSISPTAGNDFTISSIAATHNLSSQTATGQIQYSYSSSFTSPSIVGSTFALSTTATTTTASSLSISVTNGQTLYLRFYVYNNGSGNTITNSQTVRCRNFTVTGTTAAAVTTTNFYSKSTGDLNSTANWGTSTDGTGTAPTDFTTNGQIFNVRNNASPTIGAAWTVSGTGSKIVVGNGTNACNFTIPSGFAVTGTIDVSAAATLTIANTTNPTLGTLNATSTVAFTAAGAQAVPAATYGNLSVSTTTANATASGAIAVVTALTVANGSTFDLGTNALTGASLTTSGTGIIKTQNTTGTPIPTGRTWSQELQYNSSSAQTVVAGTYSNLNISGGNRTLINGGTINVSGTYTPGAGTLTVTSNTFNFNGANGQVIPGATYNNLSSSNNTRSLSGVIKIAGTFTQGGGNYTIGTSTVEFNGSTAQTIPVLAVASGSNYYNLTYSGTSIATLGGTMTVGNDLSVSGSGGSLRTNNGTSFILTVNGTTSISNGGFIDLNGTGTNNTTIQLKGNLNISGTNGRITTIGSSAPNGTVVFSGTSQTYTFTATGTVGYANYEIGDGTNLTTVVLNNSITLVNDAGAGFVGTLTIKDKGTLNVGTNNITSNGTTAAGTTFVINSGGTLVTSNTGGIVGTGTSGTNGTINSTNVQTRTFNAGANYTFNAATTAPFPTSTLGNPADVTIGAAVTLNRAITMSGTLALSAVLTTTGANTLNLTNPASGTITGGSTTAYIDGAVTRTLGTTSTGLYTIPLGKSSKYYPFAFTAGTIASGTPTINIEAFAAAPAGTANGTTVASISGTEYWKVITTGATFAATNFSIGRSTPAVPAGRIIAASPSDAASSYASIDGTVGTLSSQPSVNTSSSGLSGAGTLYLSIAVRPTFTVTYDANGGTGSVPTDGNTYNYNDLVTVQTNSGGLTKAGFTFDGWNTAADGSGSSYPADNSTTFNITINTTLYAKWLSVATYNITYDANSGTGTPPVDGNAHNSGEVVTVLANTDLARAGYVFDGWNTAADGTGTNYAATGSATLIMPAANVTLYAKWTYTVTYSANGGTGTVPTDNVKYLPNALVTVLANAGPVTKTGYTFGGWNTQSDGLGTNYTAGSGTFNITSITTLYAKWNINQYAVSYDGNGNTTGSVPASSTNYDYNATVTVLANTNTLARTGYTFSGWNTAADGSGTDYAASGSATFLMPANAVTLYAKWTVNSYSVIYNTTGSTGGTAPGTTSQNYGATVTVLGNTGNLVKTGYGFAGWNTLADGTGTDYAPGATFTMGDADFNLYPKWAPTFVEDFSYANGTGLVAGTGGVWTATSGTGTNNLTVNGAGLTYDGAVQSGIGLSLPLANNGQDAVRLTGNTVSSGAAYGSFLVKITAAQTNGDYFTGLISGTSTFATRIYAKSTSGGFYFGVGKTNATAVYETGTARTLGTTYLVAIKYAYNTVSGTDDIVSLWVNPTLNGLEGTATLTTGSGTTDQAAMTGIMVRQGASADAPTAEIDGFRAGSSWAEVVPAGAYTLTYNINTGSGSAPSAATYAAGATVTLPGVGAMTKTGYTFAGWNTQADGLGTNYTTTYTMPAASTTLYAKWTINSYTVTYSGNGNDGGSVPSAPTSHDYNTIVTVLANTNTLSKSGYVFSGWNTQADGNGTNYAATGSVTFTMGTANVTLYAKWVANVTYTITYSANGGTGTPPVDNNTYLEAAVATVAANTDLARAGYVFDGWNTAADGTGTSYAATGSATLTMPAANVILYAKWTYTVTYNANGGTGTVPTDNVKYLPNALVTVLANSGPVAKTGYTFGGWNTQADGNGTNYTAGSGTFNITGITTLYAKWNINQYAVTYSVNGGTGSVPSAPANYDYASTVTVLTNSGNIALTGYTFSGWNTAANGSGTDYAATGSATFLMPANAVTLYAKWTPINYTVTYNGNDNTGGTVPSAPANYAYNSSVTVLANTGSLVKTAHTFVGWNTAADGTGINYAATGSVTFTMGAANVTLYAKWTPAPIFSENMGTPSGTTIIATYAGGTAPATFQNKGILTFGIGGQTTSDVRTTGASSGYTGASGNGNVFFATSGTIGFSIESINAANYTGLSLSYAYRKENAAAHATFAVDYWNGSAWVSVASTSTALFNESGTASVAWYAAKTLSLPAGAQIDGLKIRFVKSGSNSIRIDDVILNGTPKCGLYTGTDGNFNNPANWFCGSVPTSASDVIIPAGKGKITISSDLNVTGTFDYQGSTAGDTLIIAPGVELKATGGIIDFNSNPVLLQSTASGTGTIGAVTGGGGILGADNIIAERFTTQQLNRGWRMLALPVASTQTIRASWQENGINDNGFGTLITSPTGAAGFDATTPGYSLLSYSPGTNPAWVGMGTATTTTSIANAHNAWMIYIRGDRTKGVNASSTTDASTARLRVKGSLR